jgi:pectin methylesterase-like acyl-CoA thioesterase
MTVIRNSVIGTHINAVSPWSGAASTNRAFSADKPVTIQFGNPKVDTEFPANRLYESGNSGPGAAK